MGRVARLDMKHVRYVRGLPQVRVRVPDDLRPILGVKEKPQFVPQGGTRDMKDAVAEIVGAMKASFRSLRNESVEIEGRAKGYVRELQSLADRINARNEAQRAALLRYQLSDETPEPVKFESVLDRWSIGKSEKEDQNTRREAERFTAFVGY